MRRTASPGGSALPAPRTPATRCATVGIDVLRERRARLADLCQRYPPTIAVPQLDREHLSLEVAGKRFGYFLYQHFGDDGRSGAVLKAAPGVQEMLVEHDPDRFWVPAFVGRHGWIGIRLDLEAPDWDEVAMFLGEAWQMTAPRQLREQYRQAGNANRRA